MTDPTIGRTGSARRPGGARSGAARDVPDRASAPGHAHLLSFEGEGCWWDGPGAFPLAAGRGFNIQAFGESGYQSEISAIVGGRCEEGHNCQLPAELVLAGTERDPDAIGIRNDRRPVGFLPGETAAKVRPLLAELAGTGRRVTGKAKVVGGWDRGPSDRGYFGVKLSLSLPPRLNPEARGR